MPLRIVLTVVERMPRYFFLLWPLIVIIFYSVLLHHKYDRLSYAQLCVFLHKGIFFQIQPSLSLCSSKGICSKWTQRNYMNNLKAELYQLVVTGDVRDCKCEGSNLLLLP